MGAGFTRNYPETAMNAASIKTGRPHWRVDTESAAIFAGSIFRILALWRHTVIR
jgi:hypothetical protein